MTHLLLNREFDLDALRVGFGPDETGVNEADLIQTFKLLQTNGKEFTRLWLGDGPCLWRRKEAFAVLAEREGA